MRHLISLSLLAALNLAVAAQPVQPAARRAASPATQKAGADALRWIVSVPLELAGAGMIDPDWWYVAIRKDENRNRVGNPHVYVGDVRTGKIRLDIKPPEPISGLAIQSGKVLYVPTGQKGLTAIDLEKRSVLWSAKLDGYPECILPSDSHLFVSSKAALLSLSADKGTVVASQPLSAPPTAALAASAEFLCLADADDKFHIYDSRTTKTLRTLKLEQTVRKGIAIDGDIAYFCGQSGTEWRAYSVNLRKGEIRWQSKLNFVERYKLLLPSERGALASEKDPPLLRDGILFLSLGDSVFAIDSTNGGLLWQWQPDASYANDRLNDSKLGPLTLHNGRIFVCWKENASALDPRTGYETWRFSGSSSFGAQNTLLPGVIQNGYLFAPIGGHDFFAVKLPD